MQYLVQFLLLLTLFRSEMFVIAIPHRHRCWIPSDRNTAPADWEDCYKVVRRIADQWALDPSTRLFRRAISDPVNQTDFKSEIVSQSQPEGDLNSRPITVPYSWFEPRADRIGCKVTVDLDGQGWNKFALVDLGQISAAAETVTNECIGMGGSGWRLRMVGREEIQSQGRMRTQKVALLVSVLGVPPTHPGGTEGLVPTT